MGEAAAQALKAAARGSLTAGRQRGGKLLEAASSMDLMCT
jgi:hypothetical protein